MAVYACDINYTYQLLRTPNLQRCPCTPVLHIYCYYAHSTDRNRDLAWQSTERKQSSNHAKRKTLQSSLVPQVLAPAHCVSLKASYGGSSLTQGIV